MTPRNPQIRFEYIITAFREIAFTGGLFYTKVV